MIWYSFTTTYILIHIIYVFICMLSTIYRIFYILLNTYILNISINWLHYSCHISEIYLINYFGYLITVH
nr:MAG TPA: hypothetical protein [Caudoviricetes sp.]